MKSLKWMCLMVVTSTLNLSSAFACMVAPLDPKTEVNTLQRTFEKVAGELLGGQLELLGQVQRKNETANHIWNSPECPEGSTVSAEYEIELNNYISDGTPYHCTTVVKVSQLPKKRSDTSR